MNTYKQKTYATAAAALLILNACSDKKPAEAKVSPPEYAQAPAAARAEAGQANVGPVLKLEHAADAGIDFVHETGAAGKKLMPEPLGGGCALLDYDRDGRLDALFADGRPWSEYNAAPPVKAKDGKSKSSSGRPIARLYRNEGDKFREVTQTAGLDKVAGYGMGVAAADYDADGDTDLVITSLQGSHLLRNDAGVFTDVTKAAGLELAAPEWSMSSAWLDIDHDGLLDLFIDGYVRWTPETDVFTTMDGSNKSYSPPKLYNGYHNRLYRNLGNGKFAERQRGGGPERWRQQIPGRGGVGRQRRS